MPFDPTKPANNAPVLAAELRDQLSSLHGDIQTRATQGDLATQIGATSANSNAVTTLGLVVSDPPQQSEVLAIASKLDELITALRR